MALNLLPTVGKPKKSAEATLLPERQPRGVHSSTTKGHLYFYSSLSSTSANTGLYRFGTLYRTPSPLHSLFGWQSSSKDVTLPESGKSRPLGSDCPFFPLFIQSLLRGLPPHALIVDDKENALLSCPTAKSLSEPGWRISRGSLWTFLPYPFSLRSQPATKS